MADDLNAMGVFVAGADARGFRAAGAAVGELGDEPRGTLRLAVSSGVEEFLRESLLGAFLATHPHVLLDLAMTNAARDIAAGGYDAGIQLGEVIDKDMIAVPVSGDLRLAVVGSPSCFGFYLYYPKRRHASPALRAFIEHLRAGRASRRGKATNPRRHGARAT